MSEDLNLKYREFFDAMNQFFKNDKNEWLYIHRAPSGRIDLTIVSNKFCRRTEATKFIEEQFYKLGSHFRLGFASYYTVDDAELLDIQPPMSTIDKDISWESAALNNLNPGSGQLVYDEKKHKSKIVTYYSYKGGVGRTIALIQSAYLLAKKGKNVLLVDLDIEAPSLYDIFEDRLDIQYGLVDYLYEQVTSSENTEKQIKITDIFSKINFDESLAGNIFVVPAGQLSSEYVFKIKQLQPHTISKKDYMNKLFLELEDILNVDFILVDSRTGLNEWGAFSLFDIADDMVFFAYPNQENVRGLRLITDLVKTAGCKNITMVFSRVDPDGEKYARELFSTLELKQEFLSILYNPRVAVAKTYPIIEALAEYQELADFLNEDEFMEFNSKYLQEDAGNKKLLILEEIRENIEQNRIYTDSEMKLREANITFIVGDKENLNSRIKALMKKLWFSFTKKEEKFNIVPSETIFDTSIQPELNSFFNQGSIMDKEFWLAYFLYMINTERKQIKGVPALKGKSFEDYITFVYAARDENIAEIFQNALQHSRGTELITVLVIDDLSWMTGLEDRDVWLNGLADAISFLRKNQISKLIIKVLVSQQYYQEKRNAFNSFKGSTYILEWRKDDIIDFIEKILRAIETGILSDYVCVFKDGDQQFNSPIIDKFVISKEVNRDYIKDRKMSIFKRRTHYKSRIPSKALLKLFWGTRTEVGSYSKKVEDWFFEKLNTTSDFNPLTVLKIIEDAIKYEIEDIKLQVNKPTCLLTMKSLEKAFKRN